MTTPVRVVGWPERESGSAGHASGSLALLSPAVVLGAAIESRRDVRLVLRKPDSGAVLVMVLRSGQPTMVFSPGDGRSLAELLVAAGRVDRSVVRQLVDERPRASLSLQSLVSEHTSLREEDVQAFLDYQARQRLLDALVWRDGFYYLEDYGGGEGTEFTLGLPSLTTLVTRAEARATRLPGLLAMLPSTPENTVVRRRRTPRVLLSRLEERIVAATAERLPLPDLLVRLLVDDDIALEAVISMHERGELSLEPRAQLVSDAAGEACDLHCASIVRETLASVRGEQSAEAEASLWLVVIAPGYETAAEVVSVLGKEKGAALFGSAATGGVCRALLRPAPGVAVSWLAAHPEALNSGALFGVMGRCDGVVLVGEDGPEKADEPVEGLLRRLLAGLPRSDWRPPVLGVDLGRPWRQWGEFVDATLGIRGLPIPGGSLSTALLEGMLAAARTRGSSDRNRTN